jgi:GTP-binding protein
MLPIVAIVGRTNVGKSTLFNRLVKKNRALTHDRPGVTRDRIYEEVMVQERSLALVDTGGIDPEASSGLEEAVFHQAREAIAEAEAILLVVDGRAGLTPMDSQLVDYIRRSNKPVHLAVNKVDGAEKEDELMAEFHALGMDMTPVSAAHGHGIAELTETMLDLLPASETGTDTGEAKSPAGLRLALLGRPNVGKSSMINSLVGEKRLIVDSEAGTTRDSVDVLLHREGKSYVFVDTAGIRRRTRVRDDLERFSVLRALRTSKRAQVTILVVDGVQPLSTQDKKLLAYLDREKTPMIMAVNKVDLIPRQDRPKLKEHYRKAASFCSHVPIVYTSTVTKAGLGGILPLAEKVWKECNLRVGTGELNRVLSRATARHQPPVVRRRRPKFYYMTQAETTPPTFVFFTNDHTLLQPAYKRYLEKQIRKSFGFTMAPVQLVFRTSQG